jgi:hypothetical protein
MQNTQQSFRAEMRARQLAADLPAADVVAAVLPDGQRQLVWGLTALEAVARAASGAEPSTECTLIEVQVETTAEARALAHQYRAACVDAAGTC